MGANCIMPAPVDFTAKSSKIFFVSLDEIQYGSVSLLSFSEHRFYSILELSVDNATVPITICVLRSGLKLRLFQNLVSTKCPAIWEIKRTENQAKESRSTMKFVRAESGRMDIFARFSLLKIFYDVPKLIFHFRSMNLGSRYQFFTIAYFGLASYLAALFRA